jgi:hypothetical protein
MTGKMGKRSIVCHLRDAEMPEQRWMWGLMKIEVRGYCRRCRDGYRWCCLYIAASFVYIHSCLPFRSFIDSEWKARSSSEWKEHHYYLCSCHTYE